MKKLMLIFVVILASCANPIVDVEEPKELEVTNPFVGTWKNTVTESNGIDSGFTFKDDGTFNYWQANINLRGSGNYTYTDTHLIFSNFKYTCDIVVGSEWFQNKSHKYTWISETHFHLTTTSEKSYGDGPYTKR